MPNGHVDKTKPFRPLSEYALAALRQMEKYPIAPHTINPGVRNRLYREGLMEYYEGLGDWKLRITDAGRAALSKSRASDVE